jgi:hypothetical protein
LKKKKFTAEKKYFLGSKITIYLSLGLYTGRPSYKKAFSSQQRTPALQNMKLKKNSTFVGHFCPSGSGSGFRIRIRITDLIEFESNPYLDPKPCIQDQLGGPEHRRRLPPPSPCGRALALPHHAHQGTVFQSEK